MALTFYPPVTIGFTLLCWSCLIPETITMYIIHPGFIAL